MSKRNLLIIVLMSVMAISLILSLKSAVFKPTGAFLSDSAKSSSNSFNQALVSGIISLTPGTAKATYINRPGPFPLIASTDNYGNLSLDFGQIKTGNSNNSSNVFKIKNLRTEPISVSFTVSDDLAGIFENITIKNGNTILSGETAKVDIRIKTKHSTPKKHYSGYLIIAIINYNLTQKIPVKLELM